MQYFVHLLSIAHENLPQRGKPQGNEWTVLAAIVLARRHATSIEGTLAGYGPSSPPARLFYSGFLSGFKRSSAPRERRGERIRIDLSVPNPMRKPSPPTRISRESRPFPLPALTRPFLLPPLQDTELDARQYDDERAEVGRRGLWPCVVLFSWRNSGENIFGGEAAAGWGV